MMKHLLLSLWLFACATLAQADNTVTLMSYNIRCGSCEQPTSTDHWKKRKYFVAHLIKSHNPDVIGLQEAEIFQVEDLVEMLDDYSWMGVGREDGRDKGETTAILFRTARFTLQGQQTLWLSPTPHQPSMGWDAILRRTLSIAKLADKLTKQSLFVLNTHFDSEGVNARLEGAKLILAEAAKLDAQAPLVLMGDFNLLASTDVYQILTQNLSDAEKHSATPATGGHQTFNDFGKDTNPNNKIDYVFVNAHAKVLSHHIDTTTYNSAFPSDHYPIIVKLDTTADTSVTP